MESIQNSNSENIQVFTTEEVIQNQVKNLIHHLMDEGKASHTLGWAMSDILAEVSDRYGRAMTGFAKDYIINMYMNEKPLHGGEVTHFYVSQYVTN
mgnify:CR=1 FL=1